MYPAEEEDSGEDRDPQPQTTPSDSSMKVLKVTCGQLEGDLHINRFASGKLIPLSRKMQLRHGGSVTALFLSPPLNVLTPPGACGKSIRTKDSWLTPIEFLKEALDDTDALWKKDIVCDGKPLGDLIKVAGSILSSPLCPCGVAIANLHGKLMFFHKGDLQLKTAGSKNKVKWEELHAQIFGHF